MNILFSLGPSVTSLVSSFILVLLLTALVRVISIKVGFISMPKKDRWNQRVVALGGGIAILSGVLIGCLFIGGKVLTAIAPAVFLVFVLGLIDDLKGAKPLTKLLVQTLAAAYVVSHGFLLPLPWEIVSIPITIIWLVGISNSVNLLDNMDGLAAGITACAALGFAALFELQFTNHLYTQFAFLVAGATLGFLFHNFNPARIFMGDAGSLPLGFILGVLATQVRTSGEIPSYLSPLVALLVLAIPLFDTTLVMVARRSAGRPLMSGGRDHSSHRIVALGLTERRAVLLLYLLGATSSAAAWVVAQSYSGVFTMITFGAVLFFGLFWIFLMDIGVYSSVPDGSFSSRAAITPYSLPLPFLYFLEIILDICVVVFVWTAAHFVRFQDESTNVFSDYMILSVIPRIPYLIVIKLGALSVYKMYRGVWRDISIDDVRRIFKAVTLASVVLVVGSAFKTRLFGLSRLVIILDWLMTFIMILGTRAAFSVLRRWTTKFASQATRAALLGSVGLADAIKVAISKEKSLVFLGVISDDQLDYSNFYGEKVIAKADQLSDAVSRYHINLLLVLPNKLNSGEIQNLNNQGVTVRELIVQLT